MHCVECSPAVEELARRWVERFALPDKHLYLTTSRQRFESWLGRRVQSSIGGGYAFLPHRNKHIVLVHMPRINLEQPNALEIVVCEELLHMRHRLDGDKRRHAKHGYDRIALQVAQLTGTSLDEVRAALLPLERRPYRYRYQCPECHRTVLRRKKGVWSCGICRPTFSTSHILQLVDIAAPNDEMKAVLSD
ncbi:MAG: hypothetical protein AB7V46_21400 [Thermomicrobiales bacterium]